MPMCLLLKWFHIYAFKSGESEAAQSCPTLGNPMDSNLLGSSVHGILQARIREWVAISFSRGFSQPRDRTSVSHIAGRRFTVWTTRQVLFAFKILPQIYSSMRSKNLCDKKWQKKKIWIENKIPHQNNFIKTKIYIFGKVFNMIKYILIFHCYYWLKMHFHPLCIHIPTSNLGIYSNEIILKCPVPKDLS